MVRLRRSLGFGWCGAVALLMLHISATAQINQQRLPNFDTRSNRPQQALGATSEQRRVVGLLGEHDTSFQVDFDELLATPTFVRSRDTFLTGPKGEGNRISAATARRVPVDDPQRPVKNFLNEYPSLFGHGAEVLSDARTNRDFVTANSGMRTVIWQQQVDDIPVFEAVLIAHTTKKGELVNVSSRFLPDVRRAADAGVPSRASIQTAPPISAQQAVAVAAQNVGETLDPAAVSAVESTFTGAERRQHFRASVLLGETDVRLVWLPLDRTQMRLCWDVTLTSRARGEMFRVLVDAQTGELMLRHGLTEYISDATYNVFTSDSPSPYSPACPTPCTTQPSLVSRSLVVTSAVSTLASPNGWINDGNNTTLGNNVDAHLDKNADDVPDAGSRPTGSPFRVFNFAMDLAQEPITYTNAAVVQLFYWNNWMHDKLYELGFTEAAGNFQTDNFGRGGFGNDAVQADAQDGSGVNNANFSTPSDGSPGRMQMFLFNGPTPDRDGDFDADVVLHEYTHGLSNRRVGGGVGISALQSGGMGEGWSDFYALSLLSEPGDDVNGNYAAGGYVTYQLSGMTQNYYFGIRRYPYSTDMTKNPLTFKDIDPVQASSHTGIPRSPIVGTTANEVHNMGEVWCVTLWDARANLINKYGWSIGNQLILQLVTDGMNLSPANPNFLQARDAIIQADQVATGGANRSELWMAFAKRGMGASATSPASSTTTGLVEAYDLPDFLSVTPPTGLNSSGAIGGPFNPSAQTYTLINKGTITLNWAATKSAAWLNLSSTSGTLAAGDSNSVVISINAGANVLAAGNYSDTVTFSNLVSGIIQTRAVTLTVTPPRLYFFPLDTDPGWSRQGEWAFGKPAGLGGTSFGHSDPTSGATGLNVFGINLNGDYSIAIGGPYYLTAGPLSFVGYTGAKLQFQRWLNTDYPSYVYATIEVSSNGTTWTQIFSNSSGVPIADAAWSKYQYDISAIADNQTNVYVRWGHRVGSGGAFPYSGWNIDDIEFFANPSRSLKVQIPVAATEGDGVLMGNVTVTPAPANNLTVALSSSDTSEVMVPPTIIVLAGQTNATFDLPIVDDTELDGDQSATITAAASGYISVNATIIVHDNETATLVVFAPLSATEGQGVLINAGTVTASGPVAADITVNLASSDTTEAIVPSTVTIPNGQSSATFNITIADDNQIDGSQSATITAHVPSWTDGTASITVLDNENTNLTVSLPASAYEGNGVLTGAGRISISGTLPSALAVSLQSSDTTELVIPASVTILAGQTNATFNLTIVDDTLQDGTQTAVVTASAASFTDSSADIAVKDNDVYQFAFFSIASPQAAGTPFAVSVSALDINGSTIAVYQAPVNLSGAGDGGPGVIEPTTITTWTNGVWTGVVHANTVDTNVRLTADDGAGHTGLSNPFEVQIGPLDHFGWSFVPSPQHQDVPFPVTISAQDAGNNVITGFTGTVALSGWSGTGSGSKLVITEMYVGTPDAIEIVNVSGTDIDISGWQVLIYDFDSGTASLPPFTVPAGTMCHAGDIIVIEEYGTSPGAYPHFYTGANIDWTPGSV